MNESRGEVLACIALAAALFAATFPAALAWAGAEHLLPRWIRQLPLTAAAFLLILTAPSEASRA
jgi:hypothetical protein